jgi:carboxymethylenebutenolidase
MIQKEEISQEVFDLYDYYAHNKLTRAEFIEQLGKYAVGGLTVAALLGFLMPDYVTAATVKKDDERIISKMVEYDSPKGRKPMRGLLSYPKNATGKLPGIVVVHENRGLNPYIEDVGRRAALDGFVSFAPDALTPLGGYPGSDDEGRDMQRKRDRMEMLEDFIAAFDFLKKQENCTGKIGVVGFCFGGWISNMMAVRIPELGAAVPYYGGQPAVEDVVHIKAPLQIHYASLDTRVNAGWDAYKAALDEHKKQYEVHFYEEANHGFHNYSTPRFKKDAADLAWERTIGFFRKCLG